MKRLLTDKAYESWPIVSIAGYGMRAGSVVASLFTWYRYAKIFGITKHLELKPRKTAGLKPAHPNEYLHVDTTYYQMNEVERICITFVIDSYSKMILGYALAANLSFKIVKTALENAASTILNHPEKVQSYLVADGGTENHNSNIDTFLSTLSEPKLLKITALKDIKFSNSPVEAIHKIMKGRYLKNQKFQNIEELSDFLKKAVYNYNYLRPHYKFYPKTPQEVYFGESLEFDIKERMAKAQAKRRKINKRKACANCVVLKKLIPTVRS